MDIGAEKIEESVKDYFLKLNLKASIDYDSFCKELVEHNPTLANEFLTIIKHREGNKEGEVYTVKNQNLDFSLTVAKMLADFYMKYCNWFFNFKELSPRKLLDIGCDNGIITCFYGVLFPHCQVIGVDKSESGIKCAEELAKKLNLKNVIFMLMDFNDLNSHFENGSFDIVTSVRVLHEIMGTISVPKYWSLEGYLSTNLDKGDHNYLKVIEKLLATNGSYVFAERLENPAAVGQWANLLRKANLHMDWEQSSFIEFHENGQHLKSPTLLAGKKNENIDTVEGIRKLYLKNTSMELKYGEELKSVSAEIVFNNKQGKKLINGTLLNFHNHEWYKMRFEIWTNEECLLVYGYGNMGYRNLMVFPLSSRVEAENRLRDIIKQFRDNGEVFQYTTVVDRDIKEDFL
ncbi:class I SAM-dependent methyltransferase [Alkalihalobacterium bogoriense]|uniref:class I SAM-dependent methyltransferase n=1 Tax=Alkalihalobacterium bogoriense TaxID=246272 RepID=UPI000478D8C4|nr:class I SAM-dependent methyltransferase [Alkalihalobacterium bogoriense]